ncbi:MAG: L-serine ammonia-lyase [Deltaproteobacteria bacterium]|jgi:L-serine dehydratase|nr:L-serine ammonia-lyase [Deltaproteobacteria bacterium]
MFSSPSPITTSIFELFKPGPGPSSSHTIGPMLACLDFRSLLEALPERDKSGAARLRVRLLGSLSATGKGHGTDKAVVAGLLGHSPSSCPDGLPAGIFSLPPQERIMFPGRNGLELGPDTVLFGETEHAHPFSNTLVCTLLDAAGGTILEQTYYSVGGGFIQREGAPEKKGWSAPAYPFNSAESLRARAEESGLSIPQIILANEMSLTGRSRAEIQTSLDTLLELMRRSVERGIRSEGTLPGNLGVHRKAARLARRADCMDDPLNRFLGLLNAYAFAVAEENAAGNIIVTAPTCGSAGVVPAMLTLLEGYFGFGPDGVREGLLAAAAVGFLAKHNAGIAGAEVGCQGEVGVASAMAAAMLAQVRGYPAQIVENAAEIALEHHLGLTCDPVGGYVQIPCIERNAMGALKAYNACLVAAAEDASLHRVSLDMAIRAMGSTGRDMDSKYKETARGGLAVSVAEC